MWLCQGHTVRQYQIYDLNPHLSVWLQRLSSFSLHLVTRYPSCDFFWFILFCFFFFIRNDSLSPQYVLNKRQNWITVAEWRHLFLIWVSGKNLPLAIMASMRFPALLASNLRVHFPGTLGESPEHRHFYQSSAACKILEKKNVQG